MIIAAMARLYSQPRWPAPTATFVLWLLAAASAVFWALRLAAPSDAIAPPPAEARPQAAPDPAAIAALLGARREVTVEAPRPEAASRFSLVGVASEVDKADSQGAALIAVDGQPARPFRVGAQLVEGFVLQSVALRSASIGGSVQGPAAFTLKLPELPMAELGRADGAGANGANGPGAAPKLAPLVRPPAPPPQAPQVQQQQQQQQQQQLQQQQQQQAVQRQQQLQQQQAAQRQPQPGAAVPGTALVPNGPVGTPAQPLR